MKPWYSSRTLWINVIAILALVAQAQFGFLIDPTGQAAILAMINLVLRAITEEQLST